MAPLAAVAREPCLIAELPELLVTRLGTLVITRS